MLQSQKFLLLLIEVISLLLVLLLRAYQSFKVLFSLPKPFNPFCTIKVSVLQCLVVVY